MVGMLSPALRAVLADTWETRQQLQNSDPIQHALSLTSSQTISTNERHHLIALDVLSFYKSSPQSKIKKITAAQASTGMTTIDTKHHVHFANNKMSDLTEKQVTL